MCFKAISYDLWGLKVGGFVSLLGGCVQTLLTHIYANFEQYVSFNTGSELA